MNKDYILKWWMSDTSSLNWLILEKLHTDFWVRRLGTSEMKLLGKCCVMFYSIDFWLPNKSHLEACFQLWMSGLSLANVLSAFLILNYPDYLSSLGFYLSISVYLSLLLCVSLCSWVAGSWCPPLLVLWLFVLILGSPSIYTLCLLAPHPCPCLAIGCSSLY